MLFRSEPCLHRARFRDWAAESLAALIMVAVADLPTNFSRHERVDASRSTAEVWLTGRAEATAAAAIKETINLRTGSCYHPTPQGSMAAAPVDPRTRSRPPVYPTTLEDLVTESHQILKGGQPKRRRSPLPE